MNNERIERAARELIAAMRTDMPTSATAYLAMQDGMNDFAYRTAVDAADACPVCGGVDGVTIGVMGNAEIPTKPGQSIKDELRNKVLVSAFDHHTPGRTVIAALDVEAAKQLVNRLGEAIAVAESLA
jgi:hypothetical protein